MHTQILQRQAGGERVVGQPPGGVGNQHLSTATGAGDAGRPVDVQAALAKLLDQPCRPLDVAEEEGNGAGWERAHAGDAAPLNTGSSSLRSCSRYPAPVKSSSSWGAMACSATEPALRT